jgi:TonB-dependent SusC/RagA subfamily outer membrane receptor
MKKLPLSTKALFCGTLLVLLVSSAAGQDQQNQTVTGDVTGADTGQSLPGANVVVKGTQIGTATDSDGTYQLTVPTRRDTLVFSFVGYQTREVPIDGRATIDVTLQPEAVAAEEVVVVGYATQQEREVTGAVSTVDGAELAEQPDVQVSSALQGNVPGVTVTQTSGQPGETEGTIRIRGTGTLGNANPLILIDGVEGSLNNIASSNIESVTVLKDAASAAIYGNRAPNGVILVTTKRGGGEISASYSASVGTRSATRQPEFVEGGEYMRLESMGATNLGN